MSTFHTLASDVDPGQADEVVFPPCLIGYLRASTAEQSEHGHSLGAQETAIRDACVRRGFRLLEVVADEGLSGRHLERPKLHAALQRIADGEADGLIVAKLDRLTRSMIDFALLLEWFTDANATLVALDLEIDTSTPGGRLVAHVFAAAAEWERGAIAERTKAGLVEARRRGAKFRPAVVDDPEIVQLVRDLRDCGQSYEQIARELNERGIPTVRGGKLWRGSAIQSALGYRRKPTRRKQVLLPEVRR